MNDVRKVLAAERIKLVRRRSVFIVPLVVMALAAVLFEALAFAAKRQWLGEPNGFSLAAASLGWVANIVALSSIIITSSHISGEFDLGTIKSTWVRPVSRQAWYTGKTLSAWIMTGGLFLAATLVVLLLAGTTTGFSDLVEKNYVIHSKLSLSLRFAETALLLLLSLFAIATGMAAIAAYCNRPGASIAAGIGVGVLFAVLGFFPFARPFLLSTSLSLPVEQLSAMTEGIPTPLPWGALAWRTAACASAWLGLSFAVGSVGIRRKEITF